MARGRRRRAGHPARRGGARLRTLLPERPGPFCGRGRHRSRSRDRSLDRRAPPRVDHGRPRTGSRLPHRRRTAAMRWLALLAAVLAAAVLPYARPGIGVPLVAAIVALAVASSARRSARLLVLGGLALALACMPAWPDAPWIVAADLVAACLLATVAVAGVSVVAPAAPVRALVDVRPLLPSG